MKLVFAGTPEFASRALEQIMAAGIEVVLVLTQPDRPAGRGMKLQASAVKHLAVQHQLAVAQPQSLRLDGKYPDDALAAKATLSAAFQEADIMVVAAYGLILPEWVLALPRLGCINIHASLLPRWRGAAPIHRAIQAGDSETGVCIMQMDAGLDTGAILLRQAIPITPTDTTASLHDQLAALGAQLCVDALQQLDRSQLIATPQSEVGVSYAHKIEKAEARINWHEDATTIARQVRAFNPFPVSYSQWGEETLKIWAAEVATHELDALAGRICRADAAGILVACGQGSFLNLTEVQLAGSKRMAVVDFLRGHPLTAGQTFVL